MLDKELIKRMILEKPIRKAYVKREIKQVEIDKIFTIIGPRRAGKTYFLFQIIDDLVSEGINADKILYINFEDERLAEIGKEDLQGIIDAYYELYPHNKKETIYFMFDEIQNVPFWSKFVRRLNDKEKCRIYVTGSSAKLLSKEIATELRGRTWSYMVYPFSFREYLAASGVKLGKHAKYAERHLIVSHFERYLNAGGFPETINFDEFTRCGVLQNYFETIVFRDVVERHNLQNVEAVKDSARYLVSNFARPFSVNRFYNTLKSMGRALSKDSLYAIVSHLEDTLYFRLVPIYSASAKARMINPKKVYVIDNGFVNCMVSKKEEGWLYENLVSTTLIRRGYALHYFKGKNECDFIATDSFRTLPIQVTLNPGDERETKGLIEAMDAVGAKEGLMIPKDVRAMKKEGGRRITLIPLWEWLLD